MIAEPKVGYHIRQYQPEDEEEVLHLLNLCLSSESSRWDTPDLWRWKHFQNPFGPSYVLVAETDDGEIIGLRALMRWKFSAQGKTIYAARPVDTATHPKYRRWGVFTRLTKEALDDLESQGVGIIFNTPNSSSLPGYIKMGWAPMGKLHPQIKAARPVKMVSRMALSKVKNRLGRPSSAGAWGAPLPTVAEFLGQPGSETLVQCAGAGRGLYLATERSIDYLRWRYEQHVSLSYHAVWEERGGEIVGCLIVRPYQRDGLRGLVVEELLLTEPDESIVAQLLRRMLKASSPDVLLAHFATSSFQYNSLARYGFRRDLRSKSNVVYRVLNPLPGADARQMESWEFSMGDLEFL